MPHIYPSVSTAPQDGAEDNGSGASHQATSAAWEFWLSANAGHDSSKCRHGDGSVDAEELTDLSTDGPCCADNGSNGGRVQRAKKEGSDSARRA